SLSSNEVQYCSVSRTGFRNQGSYPFLLTALYNLMFLEDWHVFILPFD
ncbi:hypothetical protein X975_09717, partial [Stegodyphus mimosarum]